MGCTGSKTAQASKPEDKVASTTLLTEPSADNKETKPDVPAAEVSTTETASKEAVVDAPAEEAKVTESDLPADANSVEADQKVETRAKEAVRAERNCLKALAAQAEEEAAQAEGERLRQQLLCRAERLAKEAAQAEEERLKESVAAEAQTEIVVEN